MGSKASLWRAGLVAVVCAATAGCAPMTARQDAGSSKAPAAEVAPDAQVYEQLRAGSFQADAAITSLQEALAASDELRKTAGGELKQASEDLHDMLDSAAASLAEVALEPPSQEQVVGEFAKYDDMRLQAIQVLTDVVVEMREAEGLSGGLAEGAPEQFRLQVQNVADLIAAAAEDAEGALTAFGGELPPDADPGP